MRLDAGAGVHLSEILPSDKPAYVEHFKEREIYEQTLSIPYPYSDRDADEWIALVEAETRREGRLWNWAIRESSGRLIGGIGFRRRLPDEVHSAELGYWLAKPYWGKGIATACVRRLCELGRSELGLVRITAHVFESNPASARVLEKCGFELEGRLRKCHLKDGRHIDVRLYALVR